VGTIATVPTVITKKDNAMEKMNDLETTMEDLKVKMQLMSTDTINCIDIAVETNNYNMNKI
jgi:hypothetical protein